MSNFSRRRPDDEDDEDRSEYGERPRRRVDNPLDRIQDDYTGIRDRSATGNPPPRDRLANFGNRPPVGGADDAPGGFRRQSPGDPGARPGAPGTFGGRSFPARDDANSRPGFNDRLSPGDRSSARNQPEDEGRRGFFRRGGGDDKVDKSARNTEPKSGGRFPFRRGDDDKPVSNAEPKSGGRFPLRRGGDDKPAQPTGRFDSDRGRTPSKRQAASGSGKSGEEKKGGLGGLLRRGSKGANDKDKNNQRSGSRSPFLPGGGQPPGDRAPFPRNSSPTGRPDDGPGGRFGTSRDRLPPGGDRAPGGSPYSRSPGGVGDDDAPGGRFGASRDRLPPGGDRAPGGAPFQRGASPTGRPDDGPGGRFGASRDRPPIAGDRAPGGDPFSRSSSSTSLGADNTAPGGSRFGGSRGSRPPVDTSSGGRAALGGGASQPGLARPGAVPNRPLDRSSDRNKDTKDSGEKRKSFLGGLRGSKNKEAAAPPLRGATGRSNQPAAPAGRSLARDRAETPPLGGGRARQADLGADRRRSATAYSPARPLPGKERGAFTLHQGLDLDRKIDLIGVALFGFALVAFFAVIPSVTFGVLPQPENGLSGSLNHLLGQLFGWGKVVVPLGAFTVGIWLMRKSFAETGFELDYTRIVGVLSLFLCVLTWIQMFSLINDVAPSVDAFRPMSYHLGVDLGKGGGWIGHTAYLFLLSQLLDLGTLSVLLVWFIISMMLTFDLSVVELTGFVMGFVAPLRMSSEERARKKMAREVLTAQIVEAMRPADEANVQLALEPAPRARRGARAPARGETVGTPSQAEASKATLETGAVRTAGAALAGAAAGTALGDAMSGEGGPTPRRAPLTDPNEPPARPSPIINRRGGAPLLESPDAEANGTDRPLNSFAAAGSAAAPDDERSDRMPPPRRMPHMRSSAPAEALTASNDALAPSGVQGGDSEAEGGRRLGFLRRGGKPSADEGTPAGDSGPRTSFARPTPADALDGSRPGIPVPPRALTPASEPSDAGESDQPQRSGRFGRLLGRGRGKSDEPGAGESDLLDAAVAATLDEKPGRRFPFRRGGGDANPDAEQATSETGENGAPESARNTITHEAVTPGRRFPFRRGGGEPNPDAEQVASETGENGASESARSTITHEAVTPGRRFPFRRGGDDAKPDAEQTASETGENDASAAARSTITHEALAPRRRFPLGLDDAITADSEAPKPDAPAADSGERVPSAFSRDALTPRRRFPLGVDSESEAEAPKPDALATDSGERTPSAFSRDALTPRRRFPLGVDGEADAESPKPDAPAADSGERAPSAFSRDALTPRRRFPLGVDSESEAEAPKPGAPAADSGESTPSAFSRDAGPRDALTPRRRFPLGVDDATADADARPAQPDQPARRGPSALDAIAGAAGVAGAASLADRLTRQRDRFGDAVEPDAGAPNNPPARPDRNQSAIPAAAPPRQAVPDESETPGAPSEKMAQPSRPDILARAPFPLARRPSTPASAPVNETAAPEGESAGPVTDSAPVSRAADTQATQRAADAPTVPVEPEPERRAPVAPPPARPMGQPRPSVATPPARAESAPEPAPTERAPLTPRIGRPQARPEAPLAALPRREPVIATSVASGPNAPGERPQAPARRGKVTYQPPDFRQLLRKGDERRINDEVLLDKARVIEDTLESFGAPGKVVEVNPGPVITQFGIEPDYLFGRSGKKIRVKVGSIARLDADLALALAARSIRIEAPVPGKGIVGIEVPNDEVTLVGLHDIMEAPEYTRIDSRLKIALGLAVDGTPVAADLTQMPHLLIAGTTGSGKSVCVNAIITCLLLENTPEDVQFIMVDPKRVELTGYNGVPHLVAPVVVDLERIVGVLQWVQREMDERYQKFAAIAARNILDYNNKRGPDVQKMPYYVVVIDELADLMMLAPDETERLLARLAQMARATGIHLIISTQRPSVDIITGLIKANFPARIAFAVASSVDSRVILDQPGAEKLLGRGDMLYQSPDAAAPLRMQGVFVSDEEINRITTYWRSQALQAGTTPGIVSTARALDVEPDPLAPSSASHRRSSRPAQPMLWNQENMTEDDGGSDDEMYDEAVDLVQRLNKASISLLQRRLRIGYTRAARLIDLMEADGIIGPAQEGSKPREVIKPKIESRD